MPPLLVDDLPPAQLFDDPKPVEPKKRRRFTMFGEKETTEQQPVEPGKTNERKPRVSTPRRVDSSDFFERIWAAAGRRIERNIGDVPLGRVLQLQAGATGVILDDAVKGTAADKPVQWLVRTEAKVSKVGAVLAAPALVVMIERNPAAAETLAPFLIDALMAMGPAMVKSLERAEKRRGDFAKAMAGLGPAFGLGEDEPVTPEILLSWIFPPPEQRTAAQEATGAAA